MTLRGEPTWGGVAAPTSVPVAEGATVTETPPTSSGSENDDAVSTAPIDELEAQVYAVRDLHGEQRGEARRTLTRARSRMSETTYRRALELARDTALLSLEECLSGALAMEWEPMPRPEFSLETIEAAVAEQERDGMNGNGQDPSA